MDFWQTSRDTSYIFTKNENKISDAFNLNRNLKMGNSFLCVAVDTEGVIIAFSCIMLLWDHWEAAQVSFRSFQYWVLFASSDKVLLF